MLLNVQYFGKRLPLTLSMPWLARHVTFGPDRLAQMVAEDAVKLCADCPADFKIAGPVPAQEPVSSVVHATMPKLMATSNRKRKPAKKKE